MQTYQYKWVITTLDGLYPDGKRWELYSLASNPGYWKYEGKVCANGTGGYSIHGVTGYTTMADGAKATLDQAIARNADIDSRLSR